HRHGAVNPKPPRFIAAGGDHPPVRSAPDQHRLSHQAAVLQPFYGHKEGVQIKMCHATIHSYDTINVNHLASKIANKKDVAEVFCRHDLGKFINHRFKTFNKLERAPPKMSTQKMVESHFPS